MNSADLEALRSNKAIPCRRQVNGEAGGATVYCIVLGDGLIIDCGSDGYAERRKSELHDFVTDIALAAIQKEHQP